MFPFDDVIMCWFICRRDVTKEDGVHQAGNLLPDICHFIFHPLLENNYLQSPTRLLLLQNNVYNNRYVEASKASYLV